MLTRSNYHEWSLVMKVSLEALRLWEAVEGGAKVERYLDRMVLAAILRAVPMEMKAGLAVKETAREAWAALETMRMGDTCVKEANAQQFIKAFKNVTFVYGESIDEFAWRVHGIVDKLRELGEERFRQIAVVIETLMDLNKMSIEELIVRLRVAEEADDEDEGETVQGVERLLLTEEQWEVRWRQRDGKEHSRSEARRDGGDRGGCGGGRDGDDYDARSTSSSTSGRHRGRCFNCGERGHI